VQAITTLKTRLTAQYSAQLAVRLGIHTGPVVVGVMGGGGWMVAEAERQPVLVAWEDLHWADPTTLELLGLVIEQAPTVLMLHVLTSRPEFSPPWPSRSHITPLVLNRLERPQVEALITQRAGGKTLPAELV
jgi:predicted ATPase